MGCVPLASMFPEDLGEHVHHHMGYSVRRGDVATRIFPVGPLAVFVSHVADYTLPVLNCKKNLSNHENLFGDSDLPLVNSSFAMPSEFLFSEFV